MLLPLFRVPPTIALLLVIWCADAACLAVVIVICACPLLLLLLVAKQFSTMIVS
jgi:hypothetical protein